MRTCPSCQRNYADDTDFCPRDGTPLLSPIAETQFDLNIGLSRRYRIVRRLGEGGMGAVFLAEQLTVGNRLVALKVLRRKLLDDPDFLQRFQDEASSTGRIRHQNVVTVYECGQTDDGSPYIAMEYLEGESLRQTLKRRGSLPLPEIAGILQQAARGLSAAHKLGIIHRDLKPDNIFLTRDDDGQILVKIVDFGIAKMRESSTHTLTGLMVGTPAYMSFEQASGMRSDQLDGRSDIYSLGIVIYEMIGGRVPFQSDTPLGCLKKHLIEPPPPFRLSRPDLAISPHLEEVVLKALQKERDHRYPTVLDFAREFSAAITQNTKTRAAQPQKPPPAPTHYVPPQRATAKFSFAQLAMIAAAFLVAAALVTWYLLGTRPERGAPAPDHVTAAASTLPNKAALTTTQKSEATQNSTPALTPAQQPNHAKPPLAAERKQTPSLSHQSSHVENVNAERPQTGQHIPAQADPDAARKVMAAIALGDLHYNRGEYDEAIAEYQRGLQADPSNASLRAKIDRSEKAKAAEQRLNQ